MQEARYAHRRGRTLGAARHRDVADGVRDQIQQLARALRATAVAVLLLSAPARAWDCAGHMLVGQIAWELSTPATRRTVDEMVAGLDNRFNNGQPYYFVTLGCWMDDLRSLPRREYPWSAWHYVDLPKTNDGSGFNLPEPPHVVWAIFENLKTVRDGTADAVERAKALGMLFHWVGDIHQPLHTTTWDDRGGNRYLIAGVTFSDLIPGQGVNLHTYWDKAFRFDARDGRIAELWASPTTENRPKAPGQGIIAEQARVLRERFPRKTLTELNLPSDAEAWARESHLIGCKSAYPEGPHPGNTEVRRLTPEFAETTYPIAGRRLVLAGHRLALLLEEIFPAK